MIEWKLIMLLLAGHETIAITLGQRPEPAGATPRSSCACGASSTPCRQARTCSACPSARCDRRTLRIDLVVGNVARVTDVPFAPDDELIVPPRKLGLVLMEAPHHDLALYRDPPRL